MTVDGTLNAVDEIDVTGLPIGPGNPYGNAIRQHVTRLHRESQAGRRTDGSKARTWRIRNDITNTAYALLPEANPVLLAHPDSPLGKRAVFATNNLWVTRYDASHRYPAGDFVNQHPGGAGIPAFISEDKDVDGQDIVLWHTFGPVHIPRREDWPVMPVASCGFTLRPSGFFDRNPMLSLPAERGGHCQADG
jgi:primary-amine oxidase